MSAADEIARLSEFLQDRYATEIGEDEKPVDVAIRLLSPAHPYSAGARGACQECGRPSRAHDITQRRSVNK